MRRESDQQDGLGEMIANAAEALRRSSDGDEERSSRRQNPRSVELCDVEGGRGRQRSPAGDGHGGSRAWDGRDRDGRIAAARHLPGLRAARSPGVIARGVRGAVSGRESDVVARDRAEPKGVSEAAPEQQDREDGSDYEPPAHGSCAYRQPQVLASAWLAQRHATLRWSGRAAWYGEQPRVGRRLPVGGSSPNSCDRRDLGARGGGPAWASENRRS